MISKCNCPTANAAAAGRASGGVAVEQAVVAHSREKNGSLGLVANLPQHGLAQNGINPRLVAFSLPLEP